MTQSTTRIPNLDLINDKDSEDKLYVARKVGGQYKDRSILLSDFLSGILAPDGNNDIDLTGINLLNANSLTVAGLTDLKPYILFGGSEITVLKMKL